MFKVKAKIHSLDGELSEVTIVKENGYNDVVAEYRGSYYTAVFNPFVGCYFVDDKYGYIGDCKKSR